MQYKEIARGKSDNGPGDKIITRKKARTRTLFNSLLLWLPHNLHINLPFALDYLHCELASLPFTIMIVLLLLLVFIGHREGQWVYRDEDAVQYSPPHLRTTTAISSFPHWELGSALFVCFFFFFITATKLRSLTAVLFFLYFQ